MQAEIARQKESGLKAKIGKDIGSSKATLIPVVKSEDHISLRQAFLGTESDLQLLKTVNRITLLAKECKLVRNRSSVTAY